MSNPFADGVNNANRIENEVAALYLARQSMTKRLPKYAEIIPLVYDWKSLSVDEPAHGDEEYFGWSFIEYRPGVLLVDKWDDLALESKKTLVTDIAEIFGAIQSVELPKGVYGYGGLSIKNDEIISGEDPTVPGGPFKSNTEWWIAILGETLDQASKSTVLRGWQDNGLRSRVDEYMTKEVPLLASKLNNSKLVLLHRDFGTISTED
jgi:hypothetical protein